MPETPEQMTRRVLSERYPRPNPAREAVQAAARFGEAMRSLTASLTLWNATFEFLPVNREPEGHP